jgi:ankyrin repeat protein
MKALLDAGADVTARLRQVRNLTPLHIAVQMVNPISVELLLDKKADPNALDATGQTPLDYVRNNRNEVAERIATLLREHGARDDIARMDRIMVCRGDYSSTVVYRSTNIWHRATNSGFTLLEALALHYSGPPTGLAFPDLANIRMRRPGSDGRWQKREVDVRSILRADCSGDLPLQWGDVVEIPEIPHPVGENWSGFSAEEVEGFKRCLDREVQLIVEGESASLKLALGPVRTPAGITQFVPPFRLRQAVLGSGRILSTSDLSRVKVRRPSENAEWVIDCSSDAAPARHFWLKNGDIIEVPAKSS